MGWLKENEFTSVWLNEDAEAPDREKEAYGTTRKKVLCCANNNI